MLHNKDSTQRTETRTGCCIGFCVMSCVLCHHALCASCVIVAASNLYPLTSPWRSSSTSTSTSPWNDTDAAYVQHDLIKGAQDSRPLRDHSQTRTPRLPPRGTGYNSHRLPSNASNPPPPHTHTQAKNPPDTLWLLCCAGSCVSGVVRYDREGRCVYLACVSKSSRNSKSVHLEG